MSAISTKIFAGKTAFISGAGSGIGEATAIQFAKEGANLFLIGRRREALEKTAEKARAFGVKVDVFGLDVSDFNSVRKLIAGFSDLDIAVNNAGIEGSIGHTLDLSESDFDEVIDINVKALWVAMQEQIRWFRFHQRPGAIINVSSIAGIRSFPQSSLYGASKHAVIGLSQAAALEQIQHGIRINVVSPGSIDTDMLRRIFPGGLEPLGKSQPAGRVGTPEEIADAILWLASDRSRFVIGHNLVVDGGKTILG